MTDGLESKMEGVADIWSALNCIKIISNVDKFKNWLKTEHKINNVDDIFEGYQFFLELTIRSFLYKIIYNASSSIKEDFVFYRARFVGVELNKIPNTCEKTILIKNINKRLRLIKKAKNYEEIKGAIDQLKNDVLDVFDKIYEENVASSPKLNISKDTALIYIAMNHVLIFLNDFLIDLSESIPRGYWVSVLNNKINPEQLKRSFKGYKYSLQFVWLSLLGEKYYSSSVKNLHKTKDWRILDSYFEIIMKEVIAPLEKKLKIHLGSPDILYLKENISSDAFKDLLKLEEPQLNEKERVDYTLLWYPIEFRDSQESHIFDGVPAFISLLAGTAEIKRKFAKGEKACVCKFVHPTKNSDKNSFTYGVLIEIFGSILDASGWILFFDCCNDGFAYPEHAMAEEFIEAYTKEDLIEVRELVIDRDKLKEYIVDKITSEENRKKVEYNLEEKTERTKEKEIVNEARGLVLELITYYTLSKKKIYGKVDWNVTKNGDQLDIIRETTDDFTLIECKRDPNNMDLDYESEKLKNKLDNYDTDKKKSCEFWFWIRPTQPISEKLKIQYKVLSELVETDPIWRNKKVDKIKTILDKGNMEGKNMQIKPKAQHQEKYEKIEHGSLPEEMRE